MIPEITVDLMVEVEDLNADLVTNDPLSDTPQGMLPSDQVALVSFVPDSQPPEDAEAEVLRVVPSTQPVTLQMPPRRVTRRQSNRRVVEQYLPPPPPITPSAPDMPAAGTSRGRGFCVCEHPLRWLERQLHGDVLRLAVLYHHRRGPSMFHRRRMWSSGRDAYSY